MSTSSVASTGWRSSPRARLENTSASPRAIFPASRWPGWSPSHERNSRAGMIFRRSCSSRSAWVSRRGESPLQRPFVTGRSRLPGATWKPGRTPSLVASGRFPGITCRRLPLPARRTRGSFLAALASRFPPGGGDSPGLLCPILKHQNAKTHGRFRFDEPRPMAGNRSP